MSNIDLWDWARSIFGGAAENRILSLKRVQNQRNGQVFATIRLSKGADRVSTLALLFAAARKRQFRIRTARTYGQRSSIRTQLNHLEAGVRSNDVRANGPPNQPAGLGIEVRIDPLNNQKAQLDMMEVCENGPLKANTELITALSWNCHEMGRGKRIAVEMALNQLQPTVVMIQETRRKAYHHPFRFPGYQTLEATDEPGLPGRRGVLLAVKSELLSYRVGKVSPFFIFARVVFKNSQTNVLAACVYLPPKGIKAHTSVIRREFFAELGTLMRKFPSDQVILAGDWNLTATEVSRHSTRYSVTRISLVGNSQITYKGQSDRGDLDHFLTDLQFAREATAEIAPVSQLVTSDHLPIFLRCKLRTKGDSVRSADLPLLSKPGWNKPKILSSVNQIRYHNRFLGLAAYADDMTLDEFAKNFETTVSEVGDELSLRKQVPVTRRGKRVILLSKSVKRLIRHRKSLEKQIKGRGTSDQQLVDWKLQLMELNYRIKIELKKITERQFQAEVAKGCALLGAGHTKLFFKWANSLKEDACLRRAAVNPIQGDDGVLLVQPEDILQAWKEHFSELNDDVKTVDSLGSDEHKLPKFKDLEGCDGEITMTELQAVLKDVEAGKAAGPDDIPSEWFKIGRLSKQWHAPGVEKDQPNPLATVLLKLVNRMFAESKIPDRWETADVVPVPKKGDPTSRNDHRGIALIPIAIKLVCKILNTRLVEKLELRSSGGVKNHGGLIEEQAGFRPQEESIAQVVLLQEVCQRRLICGKQTLLAFIDFKKAYDVVPHSMLWYKLEQRGVPSKIMQFIKNMYKVSKSQVKLPDGSRSSTWSYGRGLRQGCPLSPLLFSVYIDDILDDGAREFGVEVPMKGTTTTGAKRLAGLLFADDLVLTAGTCSNLSELLAKVTKWSNLWAMKVGISKCGIMAISDETDLGNLKAQLAAQNLTLQDQPVPIVAEYEYLGFTITEGNCSVNKAVARRKEKIRQTWRHIRHVLQSKDTPLSIKKNLLNAIVFPSGLYGSEVLGMSIQTVRPLQTTMNSILRAAVGTPRTGGFSNEVLCAELGVPSAYASASAQRFRALVKYPESKTWLARLFFADLFSKQRNTWKTGAERWVKRHAHKLWAEAQESTRTPSELAKVLKEHLVVKALHREAAGDSSTAAEYLGNDFWSSKHYLRVSHKFPRLARGFELLLKFRTGAFRGKTKLAEFPQCPFCRDSEGDSREHLLLECPKFDIHRAEYLAPVMEEVVGQADLRGYTVDMDEMVAAMLGGSADGIGNAEWWAGDKGEYAARQRWYMKCLKENLATVNAMFTNIVEELTGTERTLNFRKFSKVVQKWMTKELSNVQTGTEGEHGPVLQETELNKPAPPAAQKKSLTKEAWKAWRDMGKHNGSLAERLDKSKLFSILIRNLPRRPLVEPKRSPWAKEEGRNLPAVQVAAFLTAVAREYDKLPRRGVKARKGTTAVNQLSLVSYR